jgi:hypothetical protein
MGKAIESWRLFWLLALAISVAIIVVHIFGTLAGSPERESYVVRRRRSHASPPKPAAAMAVPPASNARRVTLMRSSFGTPDGFNALSSSDLSHGY